MKHASSTTGPKNPTTIFKRQGPRLYTTCAGDPNKTAVFILGDCDLRDTRSSDIFVPIATVPVKSVCRKSYAPVVLAVLAARFIIGI